ncbi:complex I subunit 4 family protein [Paenibacillus arenosi]|uniref:NADH-quinone oxidoreductase subunit M n=1 Tax=Paenibacillus arenosi TaxID=2774142 RepID=A0ABR9AYD9_9BACL|nr:NADH-quinone oxidoreductase subunit M [Paenibacillus arenosi]MBD8498217.1 NADH-quinone oxidoreductase subunit M [Paenibacillus arenosi]
MIPWLTLLAFSPLVGVLLLSLVPSDRVKLLRCIGIAASLLPLLLAFFIYAYVNVEGQGSSLTERYNWIAIPLNIEAIQPYVQSWAFEIDYHLSIGGLSLPLVVMTAIVTAMAAWASLTIKQRVKSYYIWFLLLEVGMLGVFMARDLFLFFLFFEWTLVPMFFLIGIWGFAKREKAANRFLVYNGLGSALLLVAFLILTVTAGLAVHGDAGASSHLVYSGDLEQMIRQLGDAQSFVNTLPGPASSFNPFYLSEAWRATAFILLLIAFGIKLPIFPFHTWMLRVHVEAPTPVVMLHSGVLLKMGAYGLIQFGLAILPQSFASWSTVLAIIGLVNIVYGALLAYVQKELRLLLAYSSISHMGFVLLGIAAMNDIGLQGAVLQMVSHGFISALFFLLVGCLLERTGTSRIDELGGLANRLPFLSALLLLAGLASLGLPGLSGFMAELLSLLGLYGQLPWAAIAGGLGIILSAVYVLRGVLAITYGPLDMRFAQLKGTQAVEALPAVVLTFAIILIGVLPAVVTIPIEQGIERMIHIIQAGR